VPDKFDIRGAGEITDLVDNVLIVFRNKRKEEGLACDNLTDEKRKAWEASFDALLICDKQRHHSWEGRIRLWFDKESQQLSDNRERRYLDMEANEWKIEWSNK